jgi:hypothetical protein
MLELQLKVLSLWQSAGQALRQRLDVRDDRGEVTSTTVIIVLLVVAAITAGGIIAAKITANANKVPSP